MRETKRKKDEERERKIKRERESSRESVEFRSVFAHYVSRRKGKRRERKEGWKEEEDGSCHKKEKEDSE